MCLEVPVHYDFPSATHAMPSALLVGFSQHARLILEESEPGDLSKHCIHSFFNYKFNPGKHRSTFEFLMLRSDWEALPQHTTCYMVTNAVPSKSMPCIVKEAASIKYTWKLKTTESPQTHSQLGSSKVKVMQLTSKKLILTKCESPHFIDQYMLGIQIGSVTEAMDSFTLRLHVDNDSRKIVVTNIPSTDESCNRIQLEIISAKW